MNESNTPSAVSLADYDDAMAAAIRIMKEAQLRLTPEQEAAYKARQKAQEVVYDEQRRPKEADTIEPRTNLYFVRLMNRLDAAQVTMRRCVAALQAMTETAEENGDEITAGQCGLVYAALAHEAEAVTEVSEALGQYVRTLKEGKALMVD